MPYQSTNAEKPAGRPYRQRIRTATASALAASILFAGLLPPLHARFSSQPDSERLRLAPVATSTAAKKIAKIPNPLQQLIGNADATSIASAVLYFGLVPANIADPAVAANRRIAPVAQVAIAGAADSGASEPANQTAIDEARAVAESWAHAWSDRDIQGYLGAYGKDFTPENGLARDTWEQSRRQKIEGRKSISVAIRDLKIDADGKDRMQVRFLQDYAADNFRETGTPKLLILAREDGAWRIVSETTESGRDVRK